ncbi:MAG: RNA polymerase sigma-70 factor [Bacteroidetes bacterium]|nr:RNA polymerase sigma-70 factor [Bacteroidota bacterium]
MRTLDKATFESLFRSEFRGLCFFALRFTKDVDTAREITQESFISLWEKRDSIDLSKPVKTYLSTSVRNKCLNHLRDNKKFNTDILEAEGLLSEQIYHQSDKLIETEIKEKISDAIGELPEKCREIFVLNRNENLKYQEIADRLAISVKTVETQMSKALQHMRARLAEYLTIIMIFILGHW